jgi:flagellar basal body-associated protein FliL
MLKNKKALIIFIIVILVIIIAVAVYYFFFRKDANDFGIGEKRRAEIIQELSSEYVPPITDTERIQIVKELTNNSSNNNSISETERQNIINELAS